MRPKIDYQAVADAFGIDIPEIPDQPELTNLDKMLWYLERAIDSAIKTARTSEDAEELTEAIESIESEFCWFMKYYEDAREYAEQADDYFCDLHNSLEQSLSCIYHRMDDEETGEYQTIAVRRQLEAS